MRFSILGREHCKSANRCALVQIAATVMTIQITSLAAVIAAPLEIAAHNAPQNASLVAKNIIDSLPMNSP